MRAIVIAEPGGPEVLQMRDVAAPTPERAEVRVRVRATAVNRADLLQRMGRYPAPRDAPQDIPGLEFAGEVEAVGAAVDAWRPGDRVFGLAGGGAYAELLVCHERALARIPGRMSFVQAAATPEAFITAYDALVTQANLKSGEHVLIHAAGSGVGTAAIQLARALGARAVATARTAAKLERAVELGLDARMSVLVADDARFADQVLARTDGRGVDVVLELIGGPYVAEDVGCAATAARIVLVGMLAGARSELDQAAVMRKRLSLRGTVLRARPLEEKIAAMQAFARHVVPLFEDGTLKAVVGRSFPLSEVAEAHRYVASNQGFGKVVLGVD
jgi:putative PIG3 family NAD(P)H quinone oxidoreductase